MKQSYDTHKAAQQMRMNENNQASMPAENKTLYRIGIFAAMNHVTIRTLRFYEERGLLEPAYIHPDSGYRYYTLDQSAQLQEITALNAAAFTLDEIHALTGGGNPEEIISRRKAKILDEISKLTSQLALLETGTAGNAHILSPVRIRTIGEVTAACMDDTISSYDCLFAALLK